MAAMSLENALIVHAISAPVYFSIVSLSYFRRCPDANPLRTATAFVGFVMVLDFFLMALTIQRSLDMFASALGTWIPFALIFSSAYLTGRYATRDSAPAGSPPASKRMASGLAGGIGLSGGGCGTLGSAIWLVGVNSLRGGESGFRPGSAKSGGGQI